MAVEAKRGCGYRKVGGKYLVGGRLERACGLLPLELHVCPVCSSGIKQTRSWQWVVPGKLFKNVVCAAAMDTGGILSAGNFAVSRSCMTCPGLDVFKSTERVGLLWVGGAFYPEPEDFLREGAAQGVSRRVGTIPRGFKVGETWVLIAHPKAVRRLPGNAEEAAELEAVNAGLLADNLPLETKIIRKGIIAMFKPERIEQIITESESANAEFMKDLEDKGITPVVVPDDDPDHQGSVHKKSKQAELTDLEDSDAE